MGKYLKRIWKSLIIILLVVLIDVVLKILFQNILSDGTTISVIPNFFEFIYKENSGAAFSMFSDSTLMLTVFSGVFILIFFIFDYFYGNKNIWYIFGFSFVVGGAIGNMIDRIFLGFVRDYISIKIFNFVFNFADLMITIGVICFIIYILFGIKNKEQEISNSKIEQCNNIMQNESNEREENLTASKRQSTKQTIKNKSKSKKDEVENIKGQEITKVNSKVKNGRNKSN